MYCTLLSQPFESTCPVTLEGIVSRVPGFLEKNWYCLVRGAVHRAFLAPFGSPECLVLELGKLIELKLGVFDWLEVEVQR